MPMFKMNFTQDDIDSKPKSGGFEPLPTGEYVCSVTDVELQEVKTGNNEGKPYLKVTLTVQEGDHENRKLWCNVMLFDLPSGNWFIAQFLKATGNGDALETGQIPPVDEFVGKQVIASVLRKKDDWKNKREPKADGTSWYRNDVNGFLTDEETVKTPVGRKKKSSLLP